MDESRWQNMADEEKRWQNVDPGTRSMEPVWTRMGPDRVPKSFCRVQPGPIILLWFMVNVNIVYALANIVDDVSSS